ncbi:MAG: RICIN domain-containing protein [Clostridiales bacterium]|nr:RICIN domain-containing protein [Clostridiales bacterium]
MSNLMKRILCVILTGGLVLGCCSTGWASDGASFGTESEEDVSVTETADVEPEDESSAEVLSADSAESDEADNADDTDDEDAADEESNEDAADSADEAGSAELADDIELAVTADDVDAMYDDPEYERPILDSAIEDDLTVSAAALESTGEIKAYGIDVSKYQADIDWEKVAADGVTFAFIRVGYRGYTSGTITQDSYAIQNIEGALAAGIKVGVYFFSTALTETEAEEEAEFVVSLIDDYDISYPVCYDCEGYDNSSYRNYGLSSSQRSSNAIAFLDFVEDCGYTGLMYSSASHFKNDNKWETSTLEEKYTIWVAQYPYYTYTSSTDYTLYPSFASAESKTTTYTGAYRFWQFTSQGSVSGISGNVDLDFEYYTTGTVTGSGTNSDYDSAEDTTTLASIRNASKPGTMKEGSSFDIIGTITSNSMITSVTVAVYDVSGNKQIGKTVSPNSKSYDLSNVDNSIKFGGLTAGVYRYKVTAKNSAGTKTLVNKVFVVYGTSKTIADGTYYYITSNVNTSYCLAIKNSSDSSGANVQLAKKSTTTEYQKFKFIYQKNGYYKIKDVGSGKYLTISGTSSGSNVKQSSSNATNWFVLPDGTGSYYIVPREARSKCLNLQDGKAASGKNVQITTADLSAAQRWTLKKTYKGATISGASKPGTLTKGSSFTIKGTVSSETKITSLTVAVYDTSGEKQIGKTVKPNAKSYNLSKVDDSIKFAKLSPGVYTYKVTATNSGGKRTLVKKVFVVLSKSKTVSNGSYYICSSSDTDYCLYVKSKSDSSGANIQLAKKSQSKYKKFKLEYQSNGYYKIKVVGSGKYLAVKGSSSSSGANIVQSSSATLWQVLPDGTGSYYLVPKCATSRCLYLDGGEVASGTNIQTCTAAISQAQRWKLSKS